MKRSIIAILAVSALTLGACAAPEAVAPTTTVAACHAPPTLKAGEVFNAPSGACYTLGAKSIVVPADVTINGGTWNDPNKSPGPHPNAKPTERGRPAFLVAASGVVLENLTIKGANKGGYSAKLAFNAGITLQGSSHTTLNNVSVRNVFGDCLTLDPQRNPKTEDIEAAVTDLTVTGLTANACGRQGISPVSVNRATFTNVSVGTSGYDSVDDEADQSHGEGAKNLTFNAPCTFAKLISVKSGGKSSGPITFNGCTINNASNRSGEALVVRNLNGSAPNGPITFNNSIIECGESAYVACLDLVGPATVNVTDSTIHVGFKGADGSERLYNAGWKVSLEFWGVTASGSYNKGIAAPTSNVTGTVVPS